MKEKRLLKETGPDPYHTNRDPYRDTLHQMRLLRKLRESGDTTKFEELEYRSGKWRRANITDESEDEMKRELAGKQRRKWYEESEDSDDTEEDQQESEDSDDTEIYQKIDNKKNNVTNEEDDDEENHGKIIKL